MTNNVFLGKKRVKNTTTIKNPKSKHTFYCQSQKSNMGPLTPQSDELPTRQAIYLTVLT